MEKDNNNNNNKIVYFMRKKKLGFRYSLIMYNRLKRRICFFHSKIIKKKYRHFWTRDGGGGIWYCDLNTRDVANDSHKLYSCHGGKVIAVQTSPVSPHLMTLGEDGRLLVYDYEFKKIILEKKFQAKGTDLLWFSSNISSSGMELVASFEDGVVRHIYLDLTIINKPSIYLIRPIKAHTAAVTRMTINSLDTLLLTGSMDSSIFIYNLTEKTNAFIFLYPIGFIKLDAIPNCFYWKDPQNTILIGSKTGEIYEFILHTAVTEQQTFLSYNLTNEKETKCTKIASIKDMISREFKQSYIKERKDKKKEHKLLEIEKLKEANPGLQIDVGPASADSEQDEEENPLHIPNVPNPILWIRYTSNNTIWVSIGGYDAGYICELIFDGSHTLRSTTIKHGEDEIYSYIDIAEYLLFGVVNGTIRINYKNTNELTDLKTYCTLNVHDPINGRIPCLILNHSGKFLFSIGHDGNVFVYDWLGPKVPAKPKTVLLMPKKVISAEDINIPEHPSLEQEKMYAEMKRLVECAADHDRKVLADISILQKKFEDLLLDNEAMHFDLHISHSEFLLDVRITNQIKDELQAEQDDVREELAYDLEVAQVAKKTLYDYFLKKLTHVAFNISGVGNNLIVYTFRVGQLDENIESTKSAIEERLRLEALKRIKYVVHKETVPTLTINPVKLMSNVEKSKSLYETTIEPFFFGRDPDSIIPRFSSKMLRLLRWYRFRQSNEMNRTYRWAKVVKQKPSLTCNHLDDDRKIQEAEKNIGYYKLRRGQEYEPQPFETLTRKYKQIVSLREYSYKTINNFNIKIITLRNLKKELYQVVEQNQKRLKELHSYLPKKNQRFLAEIPPLNTNIEWPELNLNAHYSQGCDIEISDILYMNKTVEDLLPQATPTEEEPAISQENLLELDKYLTLDIKNVQCFPEAHQLLVELQNLSQQADALSNDNSVQNSTSWLVESRYRWLMDLIVEQERVIHLVDRNIRVFNSNLKDLHNERLHTKLETIFMSSYLITLNRELYILHDSEEIENKFVSTAEEASKTRIQDQFMINSVYSQIEDIRKKCDHINEQIYSVQSKFMGIIKGHKFFHFLRNIFIKKFRLPTAGKEQNGLSESSSEDESFSREEYDAKSTDTTEIPEVIFNEFHCPPGLERSIYELAFELRTEKQRLENSLVDALKQVEDKMNEIELVKKLMKHRNDIYNWENETLLDFRRKRQKELNKVNVSIVLQMHQTQHIRESESFCDITKVVLFDSSVLLNLKDRVEQLNTDLLETKRLHRINIVHLHRMNADIQYMRSKIIQVEENIRQKMIQKFGMIINLDELEEEVLRKYVLELETTAEEDLRLLELEIVNKKVRIINDSGHS